MTEIEIFKAKASEHGTDKVLHHGFHYYYPQFLSSLKDEEFNFLEIGYGQGKSASFWKEYFPKANLFFGDREPDPKSPDHNIIKFDQGNLNDIQNLLTTINTAKVIIDDGSHHPTHQAESFHFLFRYLLSYGGIYIIEDIECNYWNPDKDVYGYRIGNLNFLDYTKKFIDQINSEFSKVENKYHISSITYGQNCIIVKKQTEEEINYFNRKYRFDYNL